MTECFRKTTNCVTRCIAGETMIVPVRKDVADLGAIYMLNDVGSLIWDSLDGQTSGPRIVEAMCNTYDVAPEEAEKDVSDFLSELKTAGLVSDK